MRFARFRRRPVCNYEPISRDVVKAFEEDGRQVLVAHEVGDTNATMNCTRRDVNTIQRVLGTRGA